MKLNALQDIMRDFKLAEPSAADSVKGVAPVTIWLTGEYKAKYDRIQTMSKRRLSKKIREVIETVLDMVEEPEAEKAVRSTR